MKSLSILSSTCDGCLRSRCECSGRIHRRRCCPAYTILINGVNLHPSFIRTPFISSDAFYQRHLNCQQVRGLGTSSARCTQPLFVMRSGVPVSRVESHSLDVSLENISKIKFLAKSNSALRCRIGKVFSSEFCENNDNKVISNQRFFNNKGDLRR